MPGLVRLRKERRPESDAEEFSEGEAPTAATPTLSKAGIVRNGAIGGGLKAKLSRTGSGLVLDPDITDPPTATNASKEHLSTSSSSQENKDQHLFGDWDWRALIYLGTLAFIVRLAFLHHPSVVVFDEVHFGGFAQKYLSRQYFMDLHPPLARLLVTLSAWIGGFDSKFTFYEIGADYLKDAVPYITMRGFTAALGALTVPIAFITMRALNISSWVSATASLMLLFDNAMVTQSRLILLDSYLVFSTTLVCMFWALFRRCRDKPFSLAWKLNLLGLGTSLALAASCKWVGLFAVAGVGLYTILDLWHIFGDVKIPLRVVTRHFATRVASLIILPIGIYAATFWVHFALLSNYNPGAASMSIEFQQTLRGGELPPTLKPVYFGSVIRFRQLRQEGPYLHSHKHTYPAGSKQQQVTGYHHRDENNLWMVKRPFVVNNTYVDGEDDTFEHAELRNLRHGDKIRLMHLATGRFLHSHNVEPPVSNKEHQHEVSCYGHDESKFSDLNDNWRIEIVNDNGDPIDIKKGSDGNPVLPTIGAIGTKFRLVHDLLNCRLHSKNKALPPWGFKQSEITCGRDTLRINSIWRIEYNEHPLVDKEKGEMELVRYAPLGFWGKFKELNIKMWDTNAGLSADHPFASRPQSWPVLSRGLGFWNGHHVPKPERLYRKLKEEKLHGKKAKPKKVPNENGEVAEGENEEDAAELELDQQDQMEQVRLQEEYRKFKGQQIYLMGNPIVWWSTTAGLIIYFAILLIHRIVDRRNLVIAKQLQQSRFGESFKLASPAAFCLLQWVLHWVPFFGMNRQLFLHHYLPALYFALVLLAIEIDSGLDLICYLVEKLSKGRYAKTEEQKKTTRKWILIGITMAVVWAFVQFAPLSYGLGMTKRQCSRIKWRKRWDWDCESLIDSVGAAVITSS